MTYVFIRDRNPELIDELHQCLSECSIEGSIYGHVIDIAQGDILSTKATGLVSPANSFGIMDGGVDRVYSEKIGWHLQRDLQAYIKENTPFGEVLVGDAITIDTGNDDWPYLISAPTMRLPSAVPDFHAFLASRAAMYEALECNMSSVLFPGMGTGVGRIAPKHAAFAMISGIQAAIKKRKGLL